VAAASTAAPGNGLTPASRNEPAVTATTDVVIVGAGPTGLTLAARLQQFGVSARIVDRQRDRVHESRALVHVRWRTRGELQDAELLDPVREAFVVLVELAQRFLELVSVQVRLIVSQKKRHSPTVQPVA
jgi:2-polyprenyl-6-methoxyphenol hydroxylase-like FAD-dependent oxidoreductase